MPAGGGWGATTTAVNIANELHLLDSEASLVVDMDSAYGGGAGDLGLRGRDWIAGGLPPGRARALWNRARPLRRRAGRQQPDLHVRHGSFVRPARAPEPGHDELLPSTGA